MRQIEHSELVARFRNDLTPIYKKTTDDELIALYNEGKINKVIEYLIPLSFKLASTYSDTIYFEELMSYANLRLCELVHKWGESTYPSIPVYITVKLKYDLLQELARLKNGLIKQPILKFGEVVYPKAIMEDNMWIYENLEDDEYKELNQINREELVEYLCKILKEKKETVEVYLYSVMDGYTYEQIKKMYGLNNNTSIIWRKQQVKDKIKKNKRIANKIHNLFTDEDYYEDTSEDPIMKQILESPIKGYSITKKGYYQVRLRWKKQMIYAGIYHSEQQAREAFINLKYKLLKEEEQNGTL